MRRSQLDPLPKQSSRRYIPIISLDGSMPAFSCHLHTTASQLTCGEACML